RDRPPALRAVRERIAAAERLDVERGRRVARGVEAVLPEVQRERLAHAERRRQRSALASSSLGSRGGHERGFSTGIRSGVHGSPPCRPRRLTLLPSEKRPLDPTRALLFLLAATPRPHAPAATRAAGARSRVGGRDLSCP